MHIRHSSITEVTERALQGQEAYMAGVGGGLTETHKEAGVWGLGYN